MPTEYAELRLISLEPGETSYTLAEGSYFLNVWGSTGDDSITGNSSDNVLIGDQGVDTLIGGAGNDTYSVDQQTDVVIEGANGGIDTVWSSAFTYTLSANVENLYLKDSGGDSDGFGNDLSNLLVGNAGMNSLIGGAGDDSIFGGGQADFLFGNEGNDLLDGGTGDDEMTGGIGNDTYVLDSLNDVIFEADGEGNDTVVAAFSYSLLDTTASIENIALSGTGDFSATGNDGNNRLVGNAGANILTGNGGDDTLDGGAGADHLDGGLGNDTYYVDNAGDVIVDAGGIDTVNTSISLTLGANLENLHAVGFASIGLTGNSLNNVITGNTGDNRIGGGYGNDILTGGAGRDAFVFDSALGSYKTDRFVNFDLITDFSVADDTIYLENAIFTKLKKVGTLSKSAFWSGTSAHDSDDRLIYNKKTGVLSYDADGTGSKKAIEIAQLDKNLKMTYKDFFVI